MGRRHHGDQSENGQQRLGEESDPDGAPGCTVSVDLGEDVAEDIGDREEQLGRTDRKGPDRDHFWPDEV